MSQNVLDLLSRATTKPCHSSQNWALARLDCVFQLSYRINASFLINNIDKKGLKTSGMSSDGADR
jgi:hypothetical protein